MQHTDDITCLDVCGNYAVTGQLGCVPLLCLWDITTMETNAILRGILKKGISNVSISNNQKYIVAIGMDDD